VTERTRLAARVMARRLLDREMGAKPGPAELDQVAERVLARLHDTLSKLIGPAGVHALLARALHLAKRELPQLRSVAAGPTTTSLVGLGEAIAGRPSEESAEAIVAVLANFVWLLATFIGEELAQQLVCETWPDVAWNGEMNDRPVSKAIDR
jgi:hypothetical protein